jgi:putative endonuclease
MPFTVYVLKSRKNNKRYVGYTTKTANERLHDHMTGSNPWTRSNGPFDIVHTETFDDSTQAIRRERFLKSGKGREWLDTFIPR